MPHCWRGSAREIGRSEIAGAMVSVATPRISRPSQSERLIKLRVRSSVIVRFRTTYVSRSKVSMERDIYLRRVTKIGFGSSLGGSTCRVITVRIGFNSNPGAAVIDSKHKGIKAQANRCILRRRFVGTLFLPKKSILRARNLYRIVCVGDSNRILCLFQFTFLICGGIRERSTLPDACPGCCGESIDTKGVNEH